MKRILTIMVDPERGFYRALDPDKPSLYAEGYTRGEAIAALLSSQPEHFEIEITDLN